MRLTIAAVGRLKAGAERDIVQRYATRLDAMGRQTGIGPLVICEMSESARGSAAERRSEEARDLLDKISSKALLIALDEKGKAMTSGALAKLIGESRDDGAGEMAFVIGGPDGQGKPLIEQAHRVLAFGPMTLPHGLARVVLAEQLYRAATILSGHPYHRV